MEALLIPPKIPQFWVSYALDLEQKIRARTELHLLVKMEIHPMKVDAFFGSPPGETTLMVSVSGIEVFREVQSFSHDEGTTGYDRALKTMFQKFNDALIVTAIDTWYRKKL